MTAFYEVWLKLVSTMPLGPSGDDVITFPIVLLPGEGCLNAKTASRERVRKTVKESYLPEPNQ
jgi:hypothetical protein